MQMFDLTGCTALATGASMGIGFALAPASEALRCAGASVHTLVFDVTDHDAARTSIEGVEADHGPIEILINDAGMQHRAPAGGVSRGYV